MGHIKVSDQIRTMEEFEDWFTGAREGNPVFYSPHVNPEWDDLWISLGDSPEIGRGTRSTSLSNADLRWIHTLLNLHFGK